MEILKDILTQQEKQTAEIQRLTKEIEVLKNGGNKPINLDASKIAKDISDKLNIGAEPILKATQQLNSVISKIPKEIHNTWGINISTKIWLTALLVAFGIGWYFAPSAISSGKEEYYKSLLENREQQIERYSAKNPETAKKYFE